MRMRLDSFGNSQPDSSLNSVLLRNLQKPTLLNLGWFLWEGIARSVFAFCTLKRLTQSKNRPWEGVSRLVYVCRSFKKVKRKRSSILGHWWWIIWESVAHTVFVFRSHKKLERRSLKLEPQGMVSVEGRSPNCLYISFHFSLNMA